MKYINLLLGIQCLFLFTCCNQKKAVPHSVERKSLYNMLQFHNQNSETGFLVIVSRDVVEHKNPMQISSYINQKMMPSQINWVISDGRSLSECFELDNGDEHLPCYYFPVKLSDIESNDIVKHCEGIKDDEKQSDFSKYKFLLINKRSLNVLSP